MPVTVFPKTAGVQCEPWMYTPWAKGWSCLWTEAIAAATVSEDFKVMTAWALTLGSPGVYAPCELTACAHTGKC